MARPVSRRTVRRVWSLVQEPRSVTLLVAFGVYGPGVLLGAWWLTSAGIPPSLRDAAALMLAIGGTVGILGALPGEWGLERVGILGMLGGWATHLALTMAAAETGDVWDEAAIVGLMAALIVRALRTWGVPRDPRRRGGPA